MLSSGSRAIKYTLIEAILQRLDAHSITVIVVNVPSGSSQSVGLSEYWAATSIWYT